MRNIKRGLLSAAQHYQLVGLPSRVTRYIAVPALVFVFAAVKVSGQTAIAVFKNSTEIAAGSDSKIGHLNGPSTTMCKVYRLNNLFWSAAGMVGDYDKIIKVANQNNASIRSTVEKFTEIAPPILRRGLIKLRATSVPGYKRFMESDRGKFEFIFFGMENGIPIVAKVAFRATEDTEGAIKVSVLLSAIIDGPCDLNTIACGFTAGNDKAVWSYLASHQMGDDLVQMVGLFIQLEIDDVPEKVGPPITILKIDDTGPRWIQNGESCNIGKIPKD